MKWLRVSNGIDSVTYIEVSWWNRVGLAVAKLITAGIIIFPIPTFLFFLSVVCKLAIYIIIFPQTLWIGPVSVEGEARFHFQGVTFWREHILTVSSLLILDMNLMTVHCGDIWDHTEKDCKSHHPHPCSSLSTALASLALFTIFVSEGNFIFSSGHYLFLVWRIQRYVLNSRLG